MYTIEIRSELNAWGWHGRQDQTGYSVYIGGFFWGSYCYEPMAKEVAERRVAELIARVEYTAADALKHK